jgi:hypothetical protein
MEFSKKDHLSFFFVICSIFIWIIYWANVELVNALEKVSTIPEVEVLNIDFYKGKISVDIKNIDAKSAFRALAEKGGIEIINQKILPPKKLTLKFKDLKAEEGIKELMRVSGVTNYVVLNERGSAPRESEIKKLILVKTAPAGTYVTEVNRKEVEITAPVEKKPEGMGKAMDKAQAETIIEAIMPMLEAEGDGETAREIMKELMEGETHPIED